MPRSAAVLLLALTLATAARAAAPADGMAFIDAELDARPGASGVYVLEKGEESLLARAWLAEHARHSIEVQYFIWSSDHIGTLASEALLRAAGRGVPVRVIVDDLLIDAPDRVLLALARHPQVEIRIYNPRHKVGTPWPRRLVNVVTDFRGVNQRMHDKTFIVDGRIAITGGRNMADEYYDYDHAYNFRDRDALVLGAAAQSMRASFERFWASPLSVPVEELYDGWGLMQKRVTVSDEEVRRIYRELHAYAATPGHVAPQVRAAIDAMPQAFPAIAAQVAWAPVEFIGDTPGKNDRRLGLGGGGQSGAALAALVATAREEVLIQSPYLVLSDQALELFAGALARGVRIRISTNSLASTDNLQAFSGYRNQRRRLLRMGLEIHEYRPDPAVQREVMQRYALLRDRAPVFALHAKSMVVDGTVAYIGTYNLDPRSENLNTEVGVIVRDAGLAGAVRAAIETDMHPDNSWRADDDPDRHAPLAKRSRVRLWQLLPLRPLL